MLRRLLFYMFYLFNLPFKVGANYFGTMFEVAWMEMEEICGGALSSRTGKGVKMNVSTHVSIMLRLSQPYVP